MEHSLHVIGTAGHVDHGKSTLVKALTGIDPDRLAEEKAREMTIDLGFAWLTLGDQEVGIVDVPGHRDFIENMLAGVGSIELALLVIAADEGVMPQTSEHLAILDLLQIEDGIVVLTKTDLVDDPDWLELVQLDIGESLSGSTFDGAPIVPVSAHTGQGLDQLSALLEERLAARGAQPDTGSPRLSIDRVFTLAGFGTIVTGTLLGGALSVGDQVEIMPGNLKARVRGLQTHQQKLTLALPGSRVAVNLTGIDRGQLRRGQVIAAPGTIGDTILVDVQYRHLAGAPVTLKHNMRVKLYVGAAEVLARTRVLGQKEIAAGEEGWLQLALSEPIATARGDRFILRLPSPAATLGGGTILDPHPGRRHRRFRSNVVDRLQTLSEGSPEDLLLLTLARQQPMPLRDLVGQSGLDTELAGRLLEEMIARGQLRSINGNVITEGAWQGLHRQALGHLTAFHAQSPLRLGMPREELRSRLKLSPTLFNLLIAESTELGTLVTDGGTVRAADHEVRLSAEQEARIQTFLQGMKQAGASTPSVKEAQQRLGEDLYYALIELGRLQQLNTEVVYEEAQYIEIKDKVIDFLLRNGEIDAAAARDLLGTSRKYAIAILEHLDDIKATKRVGDVRVLHQQNRHLPS